MDEEEEQQVFGRIQEALQEGRFKECIKIADVVLAKQPDDPDACRAKLYSEVSVGSYANALETITAATKAGLHGLGLERAYCLWKLGRAAEALAAVRAAGEDASEGEAHLHALLLLQQGSFDEALMVLKKLLEDADDEAALQVATNMLAAHVLNGTPSEWRKVLDAGGLSASATPELAFNVATAMLGAGDLKGAAAQLQRAEELAAAVLSEDEATAAETAQELAVVHGQRAFLTAVQGDHSKALAEFARISALGLRSTSATAIAVVNNVVAIRARLLQSDVLPKDAIKKLSPFVRTGKPPTIHPDVASKLTGGQISVLLFNHTLASLLAATKHKAATKKKSGASSDLAAASLALADAAATAAGSPSLPHELLASGALGAAGRLNDAAARLSAVPVTSTPRGPGRQPELGQLAVALLAAQLALSAPGAPRVAEALEALSGGGRLSEVHRLAPAVVMTRAALAERAAPAGGASAAVEVLREALEWWQRAGVEGTAHACAECLVQLVAASLRGGNEEAAKEYARQLRVHGLKNGLSQQQLFQAAEAMWLLDPDAAHELDEMIDKDTDALSRAEVLSRQELDMAQCLGHGAVLDEARARGDDGGPKRRKKRVRLPKGFDPNNPGPPPDPERWLPKHERSDFKRRKGASGKAAAAIRGSQGMGNVDQNLDKSHLTVDEVKEPSAPTGQGPRAAARGPQKGKSKSKKKGR